jgi:hypothetical protein
MSSIEGVLDIWSVSLMVRNVKTGSLSYSFSCSQTYHEVINTGVCYSVHCDTKKDQISYLFSKEQSQLTIWVTQGMWASCDINTLVAVFFVS